MVRLLAAGLAGLAASLAVAGPASAHSADAPSATDYRVTVTGVSPSLPGLTVRTIEAGARLELVNHSARTIEVLGYSGEPYLRIGPDGAYQNSQSPATYLNESLTGGVAPPASASPAMPPVWEKLSATPAVLWHDHRTQWTVPGRPGGSGHRLLTWSVPLRDGVREFAVTGTLDWVPPPSPAVWWAGCILAGAAVAALGLRRRMRPLALVSVLAGTAAVAYAVGASLDLGGLSPAGVLRLLLGRQTLPLLCGLAALAAGCYALLRRPAADLALGLAAACLALFAGIRNAAVFAHGVAPLSWPSSAARLLVLVSVSAGAGLVSAVVLRMRSPTAPARPEPSGADPAAPVRADPAASSLLTADPAAPTRTAPSPPPVPPVPARPIPIVAPNCPYRGPSTPQTPRRPTAVGDRGAARAYPWEGRGGRGPG